MSKFSKITKFKERRIASKIALKNALIQEWDPKSVEKCEIRNIHRMIADIIKDKGGSTKY